MFQIKQGESIRSAATVTGSVKCVVLKRAVKVRDLIKELEQGGWRLARTKGSHRQYRHSEKPELRTLTVAGDLSEDVPKGTLTAILKQAGLRK